MLVNRRASVSLSAAASRFLYSGSFISFLIDEYAESSTILPRHRALLVECFRPTSLQIGEEPCPAHYGLYLLPAGGSERSERRAGRAAGEARHLQGRFQPGNAQA